MAREAGADAAWLHLSVLDRAKGHVSGFGRDSVTVLETTRLTPDLASTASML